PADGLGGLVGLLAPGSAASSADPVLLLEAAEDGWWYSAPLPGGAMVAAYMTDEDAVAGGAEELWRHKLCAAIYTAARFEGFRLDALRVRAAGTGRLGWGTGPAP